MTNGGVHESIKTVFDQDRRLVHLEDDVVPVSTLHIVQHPMAPLLEAAKPFVVV